MAENNQNYNESDLPEDIKLKLHEVCCYMWESGIKGLKLGYASGVEFNLRMEGRGNE